MSTKDGGNRPIGSSLTGESGTWPTLLWPEHLLLLPGLKPKTQFVHCVEKKRTKEAEKKCLCGAGGGGCSSSGAAFSTVRFASPEAPSAAAPPSAPFPTGTTSTQERQLNVSLVD